MPVSGPLGYGGEQPHPTKHSFLAYQNQPGNPPGFVVEAELPETVCGRIQGQGFQRVFGGVWTSHHVTYSLVLTVDGYLLQGLGRAFGDWLGARTPQW